MICPTGVGYIIGLGMLPHEMGGGRDAPSMGGGQRRQENTFSGPAGC